MLSFPCGSLPAGLLDRLDSRPGVSGRAYWVSDLSDSGGFTLRPAAATKAEDQRLQLDEWWNRLPDEDRLVDHRADELTRGRGDGEER
jgi:hypothetical protein